MHDHPHLRTIAPRNQLDDIYNELELKNLGILLPLRDDIVYLDPEFIITFLHGKPHGIARRFDNQDKIGIGMN